MQSSVVSEGHWSNVERPVGSGFVYKCCQVFLNKFVLYFGLSITLRVIRCSVRMLNLKQIKKFFLKFVAKFFTVITSKFNRTTKSTDPFLEKFSSNSSSFFVGNSTNFCILSESIGHT